MNRVKIKSLILSLCFGFLTLLISLLLLNRESGWEYEIPVFIAIVFPVIITFAMGWKYGLLSVLPVSVFFTFQPHSSSDIVYTVMVFHGILWILWHGLWQRRREEAGEKKWLDNKYIIELPFRLLFTVLVFILIDISSVRAGVGGGINKKLLLLKYVATPYIILLVSDMLLNIYAVRKVFGLEKSSITVERSKIIVYSFCVSSFFILTCKAAYSIDIGNFDINSFIMNVQKLEFHELLLLYIFIITSYASALIVVKIVLNKEKAVEATIRSENEFKHYINNAPDGIFMINKKGKFIDINNAACKMTGYTKEEILESNIEEILSVKKQKEGMRDFFKSMNTGNAKGDVPVLIKNKEARWWRIDVLRISDNKILGFCKDISARKIAEEELKRSLEEKEVLLAEIHHRVKNNLAIISSLLKLQGDISGNRHFKGIIRDSLRRIRSMSLIHEKLYKHKDFSKINFYEYIKKLTDELLLNYNVSSAEIVITLDIEDVVVEIDEAIPCSLIINELISNSFKYAFNEKEKGEIFISIKQFKNGNIRKIIVKDNGDGSSVDIEATRPDSLGVQLIYKLAEQLDLSVEYKSKKGKGTQFTFTHKKNTDDEVKKNLVLPDDSIKREPSVYIVEDELILVMDLERTLTKLGYPVAGSSRTAEDAMAALDKMVEKPGVIIMDIRLSGDIDGIEAAEKINKKYSIPIIFRTGFDDNNTRERIKAIGLETYCCLRKSVNNREINHAIKKVLTN